MTAREPGRDSQAAQWAGEPEQRSADMRHDEVPASALSAEEKRGLLQRILSGTRGALASGPRAAGAPVPAAHYRPEAFPASREIAIQRAAAEGLGIRSPFFLVHDAIASATTVLDGQSVLNFASYNYLDLMGDARVHAGAAEAMARWGTSAGASRLVAGERPIHGALEQALAAHYGVDAALVFVSGHGTNVTAIGHLMGPRDLIVHDEWVHNSVLMGAQLSRAHRRSFRHNDWQEAERILAEQRSQFEKVLVVVEGLYSMDGDLPPLDRFVALRDRYRTLLFVDEAHALGVVGATGGGTREHFGVPGTSVDLWMGTLSKSLASQGGFLAGSAAMIELLRYTCPGFIYSVGLAPPLAGAALAALRILQAEPERVQRLRANGRLFRSAAVEAGLDVGTSEGYAVVPVIVGGSVLAARAANALLDRGIHVQPILHPAVPERRARLRFFLGSAHTEDALVETVETTRTVLASLGAR
jgi:8-amino-7-oxononanoate synthase